MKFDSIIIGAGISGLVAAHRLKKLGRKILLVESTDRPGGVIQSADAEGFLIEKGPNSLRGTHEFLDLIEELDLTAELMTADPRAPAYVYAGGQLHSVPMSPPALIKTKLISNSAKFRLLREPFIKTRSGNGEESIASFVRRRLGNEILDRLVAPFLSGVYAGDPEELSIQACFPRLAEFEAGSGSILRGALQAGRASRKQREKPRRSLRPYRLCSFRRGLQVLPQTLAQELGENLLTEARVSAIKTGQIDRFAVTIEHRNETKTIAAASLVIATPALAAARLLNECAPEVSGLIAEIPYASLASVPLAYPAQIVARRLDGFGFLAPRREGLRTLGSIWNSSLFAERAPEGWVCMTNFIGGATDPHAVELSDDELIRIVHADLRKVLGIEGEPLRLPITRYERAIPQYNIGHRARIAKVEAALHNYRGLWLAGNYLHGVSLGDCIKQAEAIAAETTKNG
jgi:protoporphyrinogen/coproporphyrinogen III oxidase